MNARRFALHLTGWVLGWHAAYLTWFIVTGYVAQIISMGNAS
jgi:hypothetical protein